MKNKKGAKQQKFIQQVEKQVKSGGFHPLTTADLAAKKAEKDRKLKEQQELGLLGKPVAVQKVDKGASLKHFRIKTCFKLKYCFRNRSEVGSMRILQTGTVRQRREM